MKIPYIMLEGFWVKNYRMLRQVAIGSCYLQFVYIDEDTTPLKYELSPMTVLTGNTGSGKSSMLDAFAFVGDCIRFGVEDACTKRGGISNVYSIDAETPMSFGFNFRITRDTPVLTYVLNIGFGAGDRPYVETELLANRAEDHESFSMPILFFQNGAKVVRHFLRMEKTSEDITKLERTDMRHAGLALLGDIPDYPQAEAVKKFFNDSYFFTPQQDNQKAFLTQANPVFAPTARGEGLQALLRYYLQEYQGNYQAILDAIAKKIPSIKAIVADRGKSNKPALAIKQNENLGFLSAAQIPEGILKLISYYLILDEPQPVPLVGIDEPEDGLDITALNILGKYLTEFNVKNKSPQCLIATQHPTIANNMMASHVWVLERSADGFTQAQRATDFPAVQQVIREGKSLSDRWYLELFHQ
ncbi:MAG: AAA family ATPase [Thermoguttaceae bacterium]